jgi:diketogulonate reductase-like aldo/keto reductase
VRAIGVSNFMPEHLARLLTETSVMPAVNQIELHPYFQQTALQRVHAEHGIVTQAWSPIGGITSYGGGEKSAFDDPTLLEIARQHGKSAAQVMLRWHLQERRSAIPKSTKPARIAENFDVFDFELASEQVAAIDALDTGVRSGPDPDSITLETYGREIPEA